jgi:hypothetical protein
VNYILTADGEPAPCDSIIAWALWFESSGDERIVARDELCGGIIVSTVFLGIDYNFLSSGPPILFETMIFGGDFNHEMRRYPTRAQAKEGHARIVRELRGTLASRVN